MVEENRVVSLHDCVTWIVKNTDITWAENFKPKLPRECQMCARLFGISDFYFAGLLLDKRRGKMREEFRDFVLH